ncbi:ATP-binding protein [Tumebacillus flagellatus]|uniref:RRM domain-containing protein n=1 Tax=Tumebacillus flagellatus TaxID=1157490 RepID=A0A074LWL3_9BACL|nr:ATP-binding protein [Tumebacillus flagellatus]KEO84478.1 hypothetical protein EL26_05100 [Tumebacillus flagellatus]
MSEILALQERVKNTIQLGESHFREFKTALEGKPESKKPRLSKKICEDIGEALVSFANADGGELLIGVEDDGTVTGVPHNEEDIQFMLNAFSSHVHADSQLPMVHNTRLVIDGKVILFFSVSKGIDDIYQLPDGRCVRRKDKATVPANFRRIIVERQEVKSREYDRQFVDNATIADLDILFVQSMADNYLRGISVEKYLQQIGLAEYTVNGIKLRMAALLLFAKDIQKWHPRSNFRILKVAGTELKPGGNYNALSDETVQGNIFELLVRSWEALRPFLAYKTEFGSDAKFEQKYIYPEGACREALVNAIAHRDYTIQSGIDVFIFDDRMEIKSAGALLSTLTIDGLTQLSGIHESRNSLIARILRENKFMRELGEGMKRIFDLMEEHELEKPVLKSENNSFSVTLFHKSVYTPRQLQWLAIFDEYELTNWQKKIIVLGMDDNPFSQKDIYDAMNTTDRNTYDTEVTGLRKMGILIQFRTHGEAMKLSRQRKIPKQQVPRFKVHIPDNNSTGNDDPIHISKVPLNLREDDVKRLLSVYGKVTKVVLPKTPYDDRIQGYGFVWFENDEVKYEVLNKKVLDFGAFSIRVNEYKPRLKGKRREGSLIR